MRDRYQSNRYETNSKLAAQNRRTTLRSVFALTRIVILLSRIIKPDDSIPRDIVCRVNITKTLRGQATLAGRCIYTSPRAWRLPIPCCELLGFHLAARPDWTNRHCQRVIPLPAPHPNTSRTFARTYAGIIRRYYLRGGNIARALTQPCVSCFNPQLRCVYRPLPPFGASLAPRRSPSRLDRTGDSSVTSIRQGRGCATSSSKLIKIYGKINV